MKQDIPEGDADAEEGGRDAEDFSSAGLLRCVLLREKERRKGGKGRGEHEDRKDGRDEMEKEERREKYETALAEYLRKLQVANRKY